jgi:Zinc dependent phospholipase C
MLLAAPTSRAYSVLTHEQVVDLLWKEQLHPMLLARFPHATEDQIRAAHAYAYGGCLIQDIGYYPFGNKFFSDLTHYVRSGDFVANMLSESEKSGDINQYAFALGALAHYASDLAGHPAVNRSVAVSFPKLRAKFGDIVTYEDSHSAHIRTEFGFDVAQVARDRFTSQAFHDFIGFEVSRPLLERAFAITYGIPLEDAFPNFDLSIGTFRYSVSRLIPRATRIAITLKKDEIAQEDPTMTRERFIYHLRRSQYRRDFGTQYKGPTFADRLLALLISILPKIGPLKSLDVKMPTQGTENLYMQSVIDSRDQYLNDLRHAAANTLTLDNRDFDTGLETKAGEYALTDETYAELLARLAHHKFAELTPPLQSNILSFYRNAQPPAFAAKNKRRWKETLGYIAQLQTLAPQTNAAAGTQ